MNKLSLFPWHNRYTMGKNKVHILRKWGRHMMMRVEPRSLPTSSQAICGGETRYFFLSDTHIQIVASTKERHTDNQRLKTIKSRFWYRTVYYIWQMSIIRLFYDCEIIFLFSQRHIVIVSQLYSTPPTFEHKLEEWTWKQGQIACNCV